MVVVGVGVGGLRLGGVGVGAEVRVMIWVRIRVSNHPDAAPDTSSVSGLCKVRVSVLWLGSP